jgi:hypothetical protein
MGWKFFQTAIVLAVIFSNIHYDWAHGTSGLAVVVVGIAAAWVATAVIIAGGDLSRRFQSLLLRGHKSIDQRGS